MLDKRKFYINGKWISPSKPNDLKVVNPSNEEAYAVISLGSEEDVNEAIRAAKKSFLTWWNTPKNKKLDLLENLLNIFKIDIFQFHFYYK